MSTHHESIPDRIEMSPIPMISSQKRIFWFNLGAWLAIASTTVLSGADAVSPNQSVAKNPPPAVSAPVTPDASPEARALLNYLYAMYGKKTLSGQMWASFGNDEIKIVHDITGKYP